MQRLAAFGLVDPHHDALIWIFPGILVTRDAVFKVPNAFFDMFASDFVYPVLMAPVTGVALVVAVFVACGAFHIVVPIEDKQFVVIERCRLPLGLRMALCAIVGYRRME